MELRFKQNKVHSCGENPAACEASEINLLIRAEQWGKTIAGFFPTLAAIMVLNYYSDPKEAIYMEMLSVAFPWTCLCF